MKEINRMSGASVELSRDRPPNPVDRVFHIKGSTEQIQYAIQLICEKAGIVSENIDTTMRRPERLERRETSAVARCNEAYVCGCTVTYSGTLSSDLEAIASTTGKRAHQLIVCPSP